MELTKDESYRALASILITEAANSLLSPDRSPVGGRSYCETWPPLAPRIMYSGKRASPE